MTQSGPHRGLEATAGGRFTGGDVIAGVSVATVLVPQSLAYAQLAGLPPAVGLLASALPPLVAAPFASSRFLQTGPVALTSLLTLGALSPLAAEQSAEFVGMAIILALLVGAIRVFIGLARLGRIAYLMSEPVQIGFTSAAAVLIMASQLPKVFGLDAPDDRGVLAGAAWALGRAGEWSVPALALGVMTMTLMLVGRRVHRLFPGALAAMVIASAAAISGWYEGPVVGQIDRIIPGLGGSIPWSQTPVLVFPAIIIAVIGFAEASAIARSFAAEDGDRWSVDREFVSQGVANLASGLSGGFPVGGSFSRSAINRLAGADTRWSGGITGLAVLAFLPLAGLLADLPLAALGAAVLAGVVKLVRPLRLVGLWRGDRLDAAVATITFLVTLAAAPRVDRAVLVGVCLAAAARLWRQRISPQADRE